MKLAGGCHCGGAEGASKAQRPRQERGSISGGAPDMALRMPPGGFSCNRGAPGAFGRDAPGPFGRSRDGVLPQRQAAFASDPGRAAGLRGGAEAMRRRSDRRPAPRRRAVSGAKPPESACSKSVGQRPLGARSVSRFSGRSNISSPPPPLMMSKGVRRKIISNTRR